MRPSLFVTPPTFSRRQDSDSLLVWFASALILLPFPVLLRRKGRGKLRLKSAAGSRGKTASLAEVAKPADEQLARRSRTKKAGREPVDPMSSRLSTA